jgi:hypothetical protein
MKRRVLLALGVAAPLLSSPLAPVLAAGGDWAGLCAVLPDLDVARRIGRLLLERAAVSPDPAALLRDTGLDPSWPDARLLTALRERRALDFAAGGTVALDGWLLARCEAALCQLLALEPSQC